MQTVYLESTRIIVFIMINWKFIITYDMMHKSLKFFKLMGMDQLSHTSFILCLAFAKIGSITEETNLVGHQQGIPRWYRRYYFYYYQVEYNNTKTYKKKKIYVLSRHSFVKAENVFESLNYLFFLIVELLLDNISGQKRVWWLFCACWPAPGVRVIIFYKYREKKGICIIV